MTVLKYIIYVLIVIALLAVIAVGIYAAWYFYNKTKLAEAYNPTITLPESSCDFSADTTARYFSATIKTADVEKTRKNIIELANRYKATITVSSISGGQTIKPDYYNPESYYSPGYGNISIYIPFGQSDELVKKVREIVSVPNRISNDYTQTDPASTLRQWCNSAVESIRGLQAKEKIYLEQLSNPKKDAYADIQTLISDLSQARSDAQYYKDYIKDLIENKIGKFGINLTIEEEPAG